MTSPSTLFRNGRIYSPAVPGATALLVTGGRVAWLGADVDAPAADRAVDLAGALVAPAFVDSHVHATDTGLTLGGLDLSGSRSAAHVCDAVARHAAGLPGDAVVLGHGWDESTWPAGLRTPPGAAELDRAAGGRRVYLSQASIHSCLVSSALLAEADPAAPGFDASGWLRRGSHHEVRALAFGEISPAQRVRAQRVTLERAASLGIAAVHECGGRGTSSEEDFTQVLALSGDGLPRVFGYWGEVMSAAKARELGATGSGGDLYADGALGSQTAYLSQAYAEGGHGHGYLTVEQVRDHLVDCAAHGMQGGFHAIGDAAIGTVLAGFAGAAQALGVERLRAARHRVEHAEIMTRELIRGFVEYGITASMQPAFDRLWGGEEQMYAQRLGVARSLESNPMGAMHAVGVALAFGSDSPVTPLDPWGGVRAAVRHHNPAQRMGVKAAFAAHTRGGWRAARVDDTGELSPGAPATFAVWDAPGGLVGGLPALAPAGHDEPEPPTPTCRLTVLDGDVIYDGNLA
jgi:predicted amidohydrolase YtcJ